MLAAPNPPQSYHNPAALLNGQQQRDLSLAVLSHQVPVRSLAQQYQVSPSFCYRKAHQARQALDAAFTPTDPDQRVLFSLPVTGAWIRQAVLGLVLVGHSSFRAVQDLLETLFDCRPPSLGHIHDIVQAAVAQARQVNRQQDQRLLSSIRVGAHDEIFQGRHPALVGVDVSSSYCYLLGGVTHRDVSSWAEHLLKLSQQGLRLEHSIADGGHALRLAQRQCWPQTPCHGDVFHVENHLSKLCGSLDRRALAAMQSLDELQGQLHRCWDSGQARRLGRQRAQAAAAEARAVALADEVRLLSQWMRQDVLGLVGEDQAGRRALYDWIVGELAAREPAGGPRLRTVRKLLAHQREQVLAFVGVLEEGLDRISRSTGVQRYWVGRVYQLRKLDGGRCLYWQKRATLQRKLGGAFGGVEKAVQQLLAGTHRCSSVVENLNSRLRSYFFLRRRVGSEDFLELLRFFLNHHVLRRSRRAERQGQSPAQVLSGQTHPHWLEMLGFQRFHRN